VAVAANDALEMERDARRDAFPFGNCRRRRKMVELRAERTRTFVAFGSGIPGASPRRQVAASRAELGLNRGRDEITDELPRAVLARRRRRDRKTCTTGNRNSGLARILGRRNRRRRPRGIELRRQAMLHLREIPRTRHEERKVAFGELAVEVREL